MHFGTNTTTRIPKLFLTAQTVNPPRFPLHVPNESIADKHLINIQIFCRKLRFCWQRTLCIIFCVQDQVRYTVWWLHWPVYALQRQISHLPAPPPNHLFLISQILGDTWPAFSRVSRSVGRVGENPGNEVVHRGASILNFILFFVVNTFFPYILFYKCTWSFLFICSLWLVFYFIVVTRILKYTPISIKFAPMNHVS